ncbi:MAG: hypothetical protein NT016_02000, partial [Candidatus Aenigmarchaeota archaeon]|nr:hypothetical protein [Candidatus Aenigmarchaeota archaeon]
KVKYPLYFEYMDAIAKLNILGEFSRVHEKVLTISTTLDFKHYTIGHELGHKEHFVPIHIDIEDKKYVHIKRKLETDANLHYYNALSESVGADMAVEKITNGLTELSRVLYVVFKDRSLNVGEYMDEYMGFLKA